MHDIGCNRVALRSGARPADFKTRDANGTQVSTVKYGHYQLIRIIGEATVPKPTPKSLLQVSPIRLAPPQFAESLFVVQSAAGRARRTVRARRPTRLLRDPTASYPGMNLCV